MYLTNEEVMDIYNKCQNDTTLDFPTEIEKGEFAAFRKITGGTKGDYYHKRVLSRIIKEGYLDVNPRPKYADGVPAHTYSVNETVASYDLQKGECPVVTLRPIAWKASVNEIFWIYQKQTNSLEELKKLGVNYWDQWDIGDGTIGQRYGATIKRYDLMNKLLDELVKDPYGRRHIMEMWQVADFETPGLNPCCHMTTWNVRNDGNGTEYLDMELKQRSSDFATSVSINELQYVALLLMVAKHCGYKPGVFTHVTTNVQIYDRHIDAAKELLARKPVPVENCKLILKTDKTNFYDFTIDDFKLIGYPRKEIAEINPQLKFDLGI